MYLIISSGVYSTSIRGILSVYITGICTSVIKSIVSAAKSRMAYLVTKLPQIASWDDSFRGGHARNCGESCNILLLLMSLRRLRLRLMV